jgi:hypothetical protein
MADDTTQRAAHRFILEHLQSQEPFTIDEFRAATGWDKPGTLNTYLRKQYKGLFEKIAPARLELPTAHRAGAGARRTSHSVLEASALATA